MARLPAALACVLALLPSAIQAAEPLKVAIYGNYVPLHGEHQGEMVGFEVDLANLLGEELGRPVELVHTRRAFKLSTLDAVAAGKVDMGMNSITPTPARAEKVDFTKPYIQLSYRLAGKKPLKGSVSGLRARVAAPGDTVRKAVSEAMPRATLVDCSRLSSCIDAVLQGKADWVAYEDVGLHYALRTVPLWVASIKFGASPLAIATPKGKAGSINAALKRVRPKLDPLRRKWRVGEAHLSLQEEDVLENMPRRLLSLSEWNGKLVQPRYCYAAPPELELQNRNGTWILNTMFGQDGDSQDVIHATRTRDGVTLKMKLSSYSGPDASLLALRYDKRARTWHCEKCHEIFRILSSEKDAHRFPEHDYDAEDREPDGSCGPP